MALIQCDFFSEVLGLSTSMSVILPQVTKKERDSPGKIRDAKYPTLYLLHGLSDDHTAWIRRTSIERYVEPFKLAVVMPVVHRSFYTDMAARSRYWTFVSEELPEIVRNFFPLSDLREDNFVAGLSMGGYGAFKMALGKPEKFAAAASLSGALDLAVSIQRIGGMERAEWENIFGDPDKIADSTNDLRFLARSIIESGRPRPKLYQWCGTEDFLYQENLKFREYAKELNLDLTYEEGPGSHEWSYWDRMIQRVLQWLPLRDNSV